MPHAVPNEYVGSPLGRGVGVDADYILFVTMVKDSKLMEYAHHVTPLYIHFCYLFIGNCRGGTLAYASCCYYDHNIYKPLTGYANICAKVCVF